MSDAMSDEGSTALSDGMRRARKTVAVMGALAVALWALPAFAAQAQTEVTLAGTRWLINGQPTHPGTAAEGLLMNVRMVNATFEDRQRPHFDPEGNTDEFIAHLPDYAAQGVNAFTLNLQGGMPGYEGAVNSAFEPDGSLRPAYLQRVERVIRGCDRHGLVAILGLYYQRQSRILRDEAAVRAGIEHAARWIRDRGFRNVAVEIANEYPHGGFAHEVIRSPKGQASLLRLLKDRAPDLLVTASGYGDGKIHPEVAAACDFLTPHWNGTKVADIPARVAELRRFGKPVVCNEDDKVGEEAAAALRASVENGCAYGLMLKDHNQTFPFQFHGAADDPVFYAALRAITSPQGTATPAPEPAQAGPFTLDVIGRVEKSDTGPAIVLDPKYAPGLLGLDGFSHVWVFWWFDRNDTPQRRAILQVHPRGNRDNPLTGVFGTRAPVRPNLIALSLCKIRSVQANRVEVEDIDAFVGTPVLDLKPYAPGIDSAQATAPEWARPRAAP